ncbi:MAG TPA: efflux RND transporter periplasmic adaptor subunit [Casimicrobiaceae bacterium]|jgi:RND family efflux transporter MFP subunit|nr:efflux RND transporter periplasmic adaptor subunit [Casimicrobiaceae bacterium]
MNTRFFVPAWLAVALLVALVTLAGCAKPEAPAEAVRPVKLARVALGQAGAATVFAGEVKPRHESELGFRIGGKLVARLVDVGAHVKKGTPLARLDPSDVALQAQASKAAVAAAQTEFEFAKAEFDRYDNLYRLKFVSASALDQKRNVMNANAAKLEQARAQLSVASNQAAYATLVADQDGVVTAVSAEVGQVVTAGQPVVRVAREEEREVAIAVPENRLDELKGAGRLAVVLWANQDKLYPAKVREIAPAVDAATRTFAVRVSILAPDAAVQWGMTANVVLQGGTEPATALVPSSAIYHAEDGKPAVWIYDPATRKVSLREVTLDAFREDGALVGAGLADGEWIVAAGVHKLRAGQTVKPWESDGAPSPTASASPRA